MATKPTSPERAKTALEREDRLKAALKANLARRKAQARKRAGQAGQASQAGEQEKPEGQS